MKRSLFIALLVALGLGGALGARNTVETCVLGQSCGGGGSGQAVPGLSGATGDDRTLAYLWEQREFSALPAWPRYYFSADAGGELALGVDTNPCTRELPCLSVAKMDQILDAGQAIVVLDSGDAWIDAGDWGGVNGMTLDNTGCGSGTSSQMTDDPCGFLVNTTPGDQASLDCTNIVVAGTGVINFSGTGSGYFGISGVSVDHCPEEPTASKDILRSDGGNIVTVDVDCTQVIGLQNQCYTSHTNPAGIVVINGGAYARDLADFDAGCTVGSSRFGCAASLCSGAGTPYGCCTAGGECEANSTLFAPAHDTDFAVISRKEWRVDNTQAVGGGVAFSLSSATDFALDGVVIGPLCAGPDSGSLVDVMACVRDQPTQNGPYTHATTLARMIFSSWKIGGASDGGVSIGNRNSAGSADTVSIDLFQNTFRGNERSVMVAGQYAGDTVTIAGQCNVSEEELGVSATNWVVANMASNAGTVFVTLDETNVYDADDQSGQPFNLAGTSYENAAAASNQCVGAGCPSSEPRVVSNDNFFGEDCANCESGGVGVDGDVHNTVAASFTCDTGEACNRSCGVQKTIAFPANAFIPSAVVGVRIDRLELGGTFTNRGAR